LGRCAWRAIGGLVGGRPVRTPNDSVMV
jgi:hypothetical protein